MAKTQTNNFDISGKVLEVGGVERISDKFSKRVLVMEVFNGKYANEVPIEYVNESIDQIKDVSAGNFVTCNFQLKANKKETNGVVRRFLTLDGISCYKE